MYLICQIKIQMIYLTKREAIICAVINKQSPKIIISVLSYGINLNAQYRLNDYVKLIILKILIGVHVSKKQGVHIIMILI